MQNGDIPFLAWVKLTIVLKQNGIYLYNMYNVFKKINRWHLKHNV